MMSSTVSAQSSTPCKTVAECRERLASAKAIAASAIEEAREANADAKAAHHATAVAIGERDETRKQRNTYRAERDEVRIEYAKLQARFADKVEAIEVLTRDRDEAVTRESITKTKLRQTKFVRNILIGAAAVVSFGGGVYIGAKLL